MKNPIEEMTHFELGVMKEYIELNEIMLSPIREELSKLMDAADQVITSSIMSNPNAFNDVRKQTIILASKYIEDMFNNQRSSKMLLKDVVKHLDRYYSIVFSNLAMVPSDNGTLSPLNISNNYFNCNYYMELLESELELQANKRN